MSLDSVIGDAAGIVGVISALASVHVSRVRRERERADKWEAVAAELRATNDNLTDQVRDLRTVALVDARLNERLKETTCETPDQRS